MLQSRDRVHYARTVNRVAQLAGTMSVLAIARSLGQTRGFARY